MCVLPVVLTHTPCMYRVPVHPWIVSRPGSKTAARSMSFHGMARNQAWFFCPASHKSCRNVTTLGISALLSNLVETVPHVQKLPEGPHGKQQDYINFVTLGNHPKPAKSLMHYIHSPTGILLQQDRPRRCPLCMKHRQFSATGALLPFQLTCTL